MIRLRAMRSCFGADVDAGGNQRVEHERIARRWAEVAMILCDARVTLYNQKSE
jgi:hypothetical protein